MSRHRSLLLAAALAWVCCTHAQGARSAEVVVLPGAADSSDQASAYAQGAALYFTHANATNATPGERITVRYDRDGGSRTAAVAYMSAEGREAVQSMLRALYASGAPLVTPVNIPTPGAMRVVFATRPAPAEEAVATVQRLHAMGLRKIAFVTSDDAACRAVTDALRDRLSALGASLAAAETLSPRLADIEAAAARVKSASVQAVVLSGALPRAALFAQALRDAGSYALIVTGSDIDGLALRAHLTERAAIWLATAESVPSGGDARQVEAVVREYRALHARYLGGVPMASPAALEGFIGAKIIVEAIRRAGPQATPERVRHALETLSDFDVGGGRVSFRDPSASGLSYARISMLGVPR